VQVVFSKLTALTPTEANSTSLLWICLKPNIGYVSIEWHHFSCLTKSANF